MTNAEKIRQMSNNELADLLTVKFIGIAPCDTWCCLPTGELFLSKKIALQKSIEYLKSEVENN